LRRLKLYDSAPSHLQVSILRVIMLVGLTWQLIVLDIRRMFQVRMENDKKKYSEYHTSILPNSSWLKIAVHVALIYNGICCRVLNI
jgi:hypothetical protein